MDFINQLKKHADEFAWPFNEPFTLKNGHLLYLGNRIEGLSGPENQGKYIISEVKKNKKRFGYGGYSEDRALYLNTELFNSDDKRTIHLGIDIWCPPGTSVYLPYHARIHSFQDNNRNGDYGPTIITRQTIQNESFFFLFGHLSRKSMINLSAGKKFLKGEKLAELGDYNENGNWSPHLHFQIIKDIGNYSGDYPGVASKVDMDFYRTNCPDPKLIFNY